ncbi:MAG: response regulator [Desulfuromonadaceae bacterium]|nr:response regulator [Desulfuromonadaceae bacterium]MDD5105093.1 response regulator [Desulfuromonadaceae bacterium]
MNKSEVSILIVDDDEIVRESMGAFLEDEGFIIHFADSGEEALENIAFLRPVVCISDMRLAGISGEAFIVQAYSVCPATGYLLHTGMAYSPSPELRALGMTQEDVFQKPITHFSVLINRIAAIASTGRMEYSAC